MVGGLKGLHVSYLSLDVGDFEVSHTNVKAHYRYSGVIVFLSDVEKRRFYQRMKTDCEEH